MAYVYDRMCKGMCPNQRYKITGAVGRRVYRESGVDGLEGALRILSVAVDLMLAKVDYDEDIAEKYDEMPGAIQRARRGLAGLES